jgi:RimJ/RimL family protein N-acetyltransferase
MGMLYGNKTKLMIVASNNEILNRFIKDYPERVEPFRPDSDELSKRYPDMKSLQFLIYPRVSNERIYENLIGAVTLYTSDDDSCFIGYFIREDMERKGYTSDAVNQVIDYVRKKLSQIKTIYADPLTDNKKSINFLEKKLNFKCTGEKLVQNVNNVPREFTVYALKI